MTDVAARPQLSTTEQVIYDRLSGAPASNREVTIKVLYMAAFDVSFADAALIRNRTQQMKLGSYIARLNKKLHPVEHVAPGGTMKRTYELKPGPLPEESASAGA